MGRWVLFSIFFRSARMVHGRHLSEYVLLSLRPIQGSCLFCPSKFGSEFRIPLPSCSPRRPRGEEQHTGLTPAAKRPPPRPTVPEVTSSQAMSAEQLSNGLMTLHNQRVADAPWLQDMYDTICRHAEDIDKTFFGQVPQNLVQSNEETRFSAPVGTVHNHRTDIF